MGIWDRIKATFQPHRSSVSEQAVLSNRTINHASAAKIDNQPSAQSTTVSSAASLAASTASQDVTPSSAVSATNSEAVAKPAKVPALIIVHYLDQNGNALQSPEMIAGTVGEPLNWQMQPITNYALVSVDGLTEYFAVPRQSIVLKFERRFGQPVWAYAYDIDARHLLDTPTMVRGRIGSDYQLTPTTFEGYRLMRSVGDVTGEFTTETKTVLFFYRTKDWVKEEPVELYLKMLSEHLVHAVPNPHAQTYPAILPEGAVYRAYRRVETAADDVWLEIAPNQWVLNDGILTSQLPLITKEKQVDHVQFKQSVHGQAVVNFVPGKSVHTYRDPYGHYLTTVKDGQQVTVKEYLMDDNQIAWYRLENLGYLAARYLKVLQINYRTE